MSLKRMTANPVKPSRYRANKPTGVESDSSDSDAASDAEAEKQAKTKQPLAPPPKATSAGRIVSHLGKVNLSAQRQDGEEVEKRRLAAKEAERLAAEQGFVTEEEEEEEEETDDDEEDEESDSDAGESSSEEEVPRRLMMRPKFVPKSQRNGANNREEQEEAKQAAEEAARKKAADDLVEAQIAKDLAARVVGKKHWDDDENPDSDVDTTDGLDPEAEEAAWRVRELKRLKRARTEIEERERELAEVERRRNLTEEERKAEDEEFLQKQKEEREGKGKMSYMQKYFHKGAFFQEETEAAGLLQRDIMGSRIQDDVRNRETLPEYLQRRDMTRLGRKGASKYKDMRSEDTGSWGRLDDRRARGGGKFDGDDRFRPDDDRFRPDERGAKGANAIPLGERKDRDRYDRGERSGDEDRARHDRSSRRMSRSYSRSQSPRRGHDEHRSRKRSTSRDRYESDKRRRVDA